MLAHNFSTFALIAIAGFGAGFINSVVGSGTLITFPVLISAGLPPLVANISNNVGLIPGSIAAFRGSRRELQGDSSQIRALVPMSAIGAAFGAVALFLFPERYFNSIVPWLVLVGVLLNVAAPILARMRSSTDPKSPTIIVKICVLAAGVYGGYFGAAQGVILIGLISLLMNENVHRSNAIKNFLGGTANLVAGFIFLFFGHVNWWVVLLIGVGSMLGAALGSRVGRFIPPWLYRSLITIAGLYAAIKLFSA